MSKYTVVLLKPDYLASDDHGGFGQDVTVRYVKADNHDGAVLEAQAEAFSADDEAGQCPDSSDDYAVVVVFSGWAGIECYGWDI